MLQFDEVSHDYARRKVEVLRAVSFSLRPGKVTVVCGPNGSGKTTLLRIAAGLLAPRTGAVYLENNPIVSLPLRERAKQLAFMSQRFTCTAPFTVSQLLDLACALTARSPKRRSALVDALELEALLDAPLPTLSVGQAQRVALARALLQSKHDGTVVLDEPLAALDPAFSLRAADLLTQRAADGATILLSVHDLASAIALADDAILLTPSAALSHGKCNEVLTINALETAYAIKFEALTKSNGQTILIPRR